MITLNEAQLAFAHQLATLRSQHERITSASLAVEIPDAPTAEAIQQAVLAALQTTTGGWKCGVPAGDKTIIAPIPANQVVNLVNQPSATTVNTTSFEGTVRIEPEFAFIFKEDLPPKDTAYSEAEIHAAIGDIRLAIEIIGYRVTDPSSLPFLHKLADGLSNLGLILGQSILAHKDNLPGTVVLTLREGDQTRTFDGKHPNQQPWLPLYWLVNHLTSTGRTIMAGQPIITGSFAGAIEVNPSVNCQLHYQDLGTIVVNWQCIAAK
ncbi:hypothetical protein LIN78_04105 [Leeia sp. TBRC 13508]|uniref:2-keto-4-pentenoate hydratase n=1 Tax=Leeia speluncae TaxID=2884804 RepID=A0ABS8D3G3_9NEIS|nr:hypothetical protein [Leeia speluncae]MCB6182737.1 hypothetical protein [Leeia speluncae]